MPSTSFLLLKLSLEKVIIIDSLASYVKTKSFEGVFLFYLLNCV